MGEICYVYVIGTAAEAYKIGVARDPEARHRSLKTGIPDPSTLLHTIPCQSRKKALALEKSLHGMLSKYHSIGEWFKAPRILIDTLIIDGGVVGPTNSFNVAKPKSKPVHTRPNNPFTEDMPLIESGRFKGWPMVRMKNPPKEEVFEIFHEVSRCNRRRMPLDRVLDRAVYWRGMDTAQVHSIISDLKAERKIIELHPGLYRFP